MYFYYKDDISYAFYNGSFQRLIIVIQVQLMLSSIFISVILNKDYYFYKSKAYIEISEESQTEDDRIELECSG